MIMKNTKANELSNPFGLDMKTTKYWLGDDHLSLLGDGFTKQLPNIRILR